MCLAHVVSLNRSERYRKIRVNYVDRGLCPSTSRSLGVEKERRRVRMLGEEPISIRVGVDANRGEGRCRVMCLIIPASCSLV